jgi:HD-GYP domain-containing protein (c-di-GMP phosphodiesterase class II)
MPRRVVWYPAGSGLDARLSGLADDLAGRPFPDPAPLAVPPGEGAVLLVDGAAPATAAEARARALGVPVVALVDAPGGGAGACYAGLPRDTPAAVLAQTLRNAWEHARLAREAEETAHQLEELNRIGVRLTAERDTDALLELILTVAREITRSDGGSLYVVEEAEDGGRRLRFRLAQNDTVPVPFAEFTLPLGGQSIAGHVAATGAVLALDDARTLPPGTPFHLNRDFDTQTGYLTKSMLVVPMQTPAGDVIGVIQLINCKREAGRPFPSAAAIEAEALPYPERYRNLVASLASQAAVALENSRLYRSIEALFEGFVQASVTAIESRDPTTSGHSFRVADLTVALAAAADAAGAGPFRDVRITPAEMKELRYASLLHDFGKVGVREEVLVKAKKLPAAHLELIRHRAELLKRGLELASLRRQLDHVARHGAPAPRSRVAAWDAELAALVEEVDRGLKAVAMANEPSVLAQDFAEDIQHLAARAFVDHLGVGHTLITPAEARILSIRRGSLTDEEFRDIRSHVVHTFQFLSQIPWTPDLRRVPELARSHHEKLDGSGYPAGKRGGDIPLQVRMMTIADIFDALTAADRPYKAALPVERALDILHEEARAGALDAPLVALFAELGPWRR